MRRSMPSWHLFAGTGLALGPALAARSAACPAAPALRPGVTQDCAECPQLVTAPPGALALGGTPSDAPEVDAATGESPPVMIDVAQPIPPRRAAEVTVAEFRRFVEATGHDATGGCRVRAGGQWQVDPVATGAIRASVARRATTTPSCA